MKRVFREVKRNFDTVYIFDFDTNTFTSYPTSKNLGFPFSIPMVDTPENMGYINMDDCIKQLKSRGYLHKEVNAEEQLESEIIGYIKLGSYRLHTNKTIEDVIMKLSRYGISYSDAQNKINEEFINGEVLSFKPYYLQVKAI